MTNSKDTQTEALKTLSTITRAALDGKRAEFTLDALLDLFAKKGIISSREKEEILLEGTRKTAEYLDSIENKSAYNE